MGVVSTRHLGEYNIAERPGEAHDELDEDDLTVLRRGSGEEILVARVSDLP